jgi:cell division initiation protein
VAELSPTEVEARPLKRRGRGYDRDEVNQHLAQVSRSYRQIWAERDELRAKVAKLFEDERALGEALLAAQRAADLVIADAEEEARRLIADARDEARRAADEVKHEREREAAEVGRLKSVRRESEARLRELADAIVALIGEADTDLESALSLLPAAKDVGEQPDVSVEQSPVSAGQVE